MEYKLKQIEAADMCQLFISVIVGKYIEQAIDKNGRLELSVIEPHSEGSGKKIIIDVSEEADTTIKVMSLSGIRYGKGNVWAFIERFLPNYYHRDDILHFDIYSRYIENEDLSEGDAEWIYKDFGADREKVKQVIDQMEKDFAYEALTRFLENHGSESW